MFKPGIDFIAISTPFFCHDGNNRILLHKRSNNCRDEQGTWDCGSGRLNFGEKPEEGVLREIFEEYGCPGIIQRKLEYYSIKRKIHAKNTHWIVLPFIVIVNPKKVINNEPVKILEIGWFYLNKLPKPLHTGFKFELKKYIKDLEKYIKIG